MHFVGSRVFFGSCFFSRFFPAPMSSEFFLVVFLVCLVLDGVGVTWSSSSSISPSSGVGVGVGVLVG